jgi:hypothetical protein
MLVLPVTSRGDDRMDARDLAPRPPLAGTIFLSPPAAGLPVNTVTGADSGSAAGTGEYPRSRPRRRNQHAESPGNHAASVTDM